MAALPGDFLAISFNMHSNDNSDVLKHNTSAWCTDEHILPATLSKFASPRSLADCL